MRIEDSRALNRDSVEKTMVRLLHSATILVHYTPYKYTSPPGQYPTWPYNYHHRPPFIVYVFSFFSLNFFSS